MCDRRYVLEPWITTGDRVTGGGREDSTGLSRSRRAGSIRQQLFFVDEHDGRHVVAEHRHVSVLHPEHVLERLDAAAQAVRLR